MKRNLADFGPLSPAERKLRDEICGGTGVVLGDGECPGETAGPDRQVRAEFLRYLILGGCAALPGVIPENGVRVVGALVTGALDLEGGRIPRDVILVNCRFDTAPNVMSAQLDTLNLTGSALPGLIADRLQATGSVFLSNATVTGEIRLLSANLGGNLSCVGARLVAGKSGDALSADRLQAEGGVFLRDAEVTGEARFLGARLGGDLSCTGARLAAGESGNALHADRLQAEGGVFLSNADVTGTVRLLGARLGGDLSCTDARLAAGESGDALSADGLQAEGDVFLRSTEVTGQVRLLGARLGGDLSCDGARLAAGESGDALDASGAEITGSFFWRSAARVTGRMDFTGARIGAIADDAACWPKKGGLILNRCRYGAFVGTGTPVSAKERMRWLDLQDPAAVGQDFWPQPWEHCAKVLREMGHRDAAKQVLIGKEARQRNWQRDRLAARLVGAKLRLRLERMKPEEVDAFNSDLQSANATHSGPMLREVTAQLEKATYFQNKALSDLTDDPAAFDTRMAPIRARGWFMGFDPVMTAKGVVFETSMRLGIRAIIDKTLSDTIAYGHRPFRALGWLVGVWLFGALLFGIAAGQGAIKPNNAFVLRSAEWYACAPDYVPTEGSSVAPRNTGTTQLACFHAQAEAASYPRFNALVYSADTLLPIVAMEMQEFWIPDETQGTRGQATRLFLWAQIVMGWALSLLAVAGFSGLIRSD